MHTKGVSTVKKFTLSTTCNFKSVWDNKEVCPEALFSTPYPVKEIIYVRGDHDGRRWWTTAQPVHPSKMTSDIGKEIEALVDDIIETEPICKGIRGILEFVRPFPESVLKDGIRNRYNFYLEGEHANYWVQFLDLPKDYNLYIHIFEK